MRGRTIIIEPNLINERGHHAFATSRFATLMGDTRPLIAAGKGWNGSQHLGGGDILRVFRHNRDTVSRSRRYGPTVTTAFSLGAGAIMPIARFIRGRRGFHAPDAPTLTVAGADASKLRSIIAPELGELLSTLEPEPGDTVFLPSADAELLIATAEQFEAHRGPARFVVRLMYDDVGCHPSDPTWRSALKRLQESPGAIENVDLLAETPAFARAIREIWPKPVELLPHPTDLPAQQSPAVNGRFILYMAGHARSDKGARLLNATAQALAAKLNAHDPDVVLRVQGHPSSRAGKVQIEALPLHLDPDEYVWSWKQAHAALLLHDPAVYAIRGSGVVCDAISSSRPFVFLSGSSLSDWNVGCNALEATPSPHAIAQAIVELLNGYETFAEASATVASTVARHVEIGMVTVMGCDTASEAG